MLPILYFIVLLTFLIRPSFSAFSFKLFFWPDLLTFETKTLHFHSNYCWYRSHCAPLTYLLNSRLKSSFICSGLSKLVLRAVSTSLFPITIFYKRMEKQSKQSKLIVQSFYCFSFLLRYLKFFYLTGDVPHQSFAQVLHTIRTYQFCQRPQFCIKWKVFTY